MSNEGSTVVERGRTAILGIANASSPLHSTSESSTSYSTGPPLTTTSSSKATRGVGRRKQLRRENARLANNPHIVRPSVRDYSLRHNERIPSFPLPADLQREFFRRTDDRVDGPFDRSSDFGPFTMGLSDANWFLQHRVGLRPRKLRSPDDVKSIHTSAQAFAMDLETHIEDWLEQDVFVHASQSIASSSATALIRPLVHEDENEDARHVKTLYEVNRNERNVVWSVADPFLRLIVHCQARIYGCASFSKDSPSGDRQTWILRTPSRRLANARSGHVGMPTPPTTDIGTDVTGTDVASTIDSHSEYGASDIDESQEDALDTDNNVSFTANTTVQEATPIVYRIDEHTEIEDDDAHLADVE